MQSIPSLRQSFCAIFPTTGSALRGPARQHRRARPSLELLESRVQPSFLSGGLDLGDGLEFDLFDDHRRDHDRLAGLASALATPLNANTVGSVSLPSSPGGASNPTSTGSSSQPSQTAAELAALDAAVRQLGLTPAPATGSAVGVSHAGPVATAARIVPVTVASVAPVQSELIQGSVTGSSLPGSTVGNPPPAVVWAGYLGDRVHAQWNAVVTGSGASAGYIFLGGTATDPVYGVTAATVEKLRADGSTDANTYVIRFEPTFGAYRETDAVEHLVLSPDGGTVYATANISTSTTFGFSGIVAAIDATAPRAFFTGFVDSKFNGVAVTGTASNYNVLVSGAVPNTTRPNGTDLLVASFDPTLTVTNYANVLDLGRPVDTAGLTSNGDNFGNQYIGGTWRETFGSRTETSAFVARIDATGNDVWGDIFVIGSFGQDGAVNGVFESGGFVYATGSVNDPDGSGLLHQDMILFKLDDAHGMPIYFQLWGRFQGSTRTGDFPGEAIVVRNGEAFTAGFNYDTSQPPGPGRESAVLNHFNSNGSAILGSAEFGGNGFDNAYGLDFATSTGTDVVWAGVTTSTDLPVTDGSVYGGGFSDAWASRWVIA
jgi:hypothetical protein